MSPETCCQVTHHILHSSALVQKNKQKKNSPTHLVLVLVLVLVPVPVLVPELKTGCSSSSGAAVGSSALSANQDKINSVSPVESDGEKKDIQKNFTDTLTQVISNKQQTSVFP